MNLTDSYSSTILRMAANLCCELAGFELPFIHLFEMEALFDFQPTTTELVPPVRAAKKAKPPPPLQPKSTSAVGDNHSSPPPSVGNKHQIGARN